MGKLLASAASGLFAIMAILTMGQPAWGQNNKLCDSSFNIDRCNSCYADAGDNQDLQCDCLCRWIRVKDLSLPDCRSQICGSESGGIGSKIGSGPVFRGEVYESTADALAAANDYVVANDLADNVQIVYKDFYFLTKFADSFLIHLVGEPFNPPDCSQPGQCVSAMGNFQCSSGINQDGNPFMAGCQSGIGCYEVPASRWKAAGCPTTMGCCTSDLGCPARTGGPDTLPNNGYYGTNGTGCPTSP